MAIVNRHKLSGSVFKSSKNGPDGRSGPWPQKCQEMGGLFFLFGLFLGRRKPFEALEQLFLGHALARDLGVVGIDRGPAVAPISGTASGSGSSTSTYFCSE